VIGNKIVIGKNGNGLLLRLESFDGFSAYNVAMQIKHKWWFTNLGYGFVNYEDKELKDG